MVVFINAKIKSFIKLFKKKTVSNLDEESRWTVHYTAPWHQQENVFLPASRPPCVEDLHRQAKLNLKSVLRECDKLRRDGYRSSQYYSQGPTFASSGPPSDDYQDEDDETDQKGSVSSSEEERHMSTRRPKTPTSSDFPDLNTQTNWAKSLPLPTPEEKMRLHAQTVQADVVPINITGENFDRQASLRRSLIYTDTLVRRPKKVKRRKTITGVPDNIQKELASGSGQDGSGGPSAYAPDHCSTLGRHGGCWAAGPRSETRDSSCQTEEVKVVPPSMRRIRAQKGLGIAAQMGHLSGSSGNMSVLSDSAGVVLPSRLYADAGFHSLPRSAARASLQGPAQDLDGGALENLGHLGGSSRSGTLFRPKSQELRRVEGENRAGPACAVSPHGTYSTSVIPNATLSSSSEVIAIQTAQGLGQPDGKRTGSAPHAKGRSRDPLLSRHTGEGDRRSPGGPWSEGPSSILSQAFDPHPPRAAALLALCDSTGSLSTPANQENGTHAMAYAACRRNPSFPAHPQDADGKSEPGYPGGGGGEPSDCSSASGSGRASPLKPPPGTPGCSTPGSTLSICSLDHAPHREGARPLCAEDHHHDGYYASLHPDGGHGPGHPCSSSSNSSSSNGFGHPRHSVINVFDGRAPKSPGDRSQSRNISLKKAKKPPLPPSRTDSLRRVPKKNGSAPVAANGQVLNESLIASLQHSLQLSLRAQGGLSPSQSPCSDLEEPWLPRSRSQSTVSGGSSLASAATAPPGGGGSCAPGGLTPSQSDTSSVKSEYTDPWGYYIDYTGLQDDPASPGGGGGAAGGGGAPAGNGPGPHHIQEGCRAAAPHLPGGSVKPKVTSPEKPHRVTSPSSGYSSQSNTPTALTPVPVFLKPLSPANGKGKPKPKVPERKSSLVSSVSISSSSTSLSSNTSTEGGGGTVRRLDSAPAALLAGPSLPSPSSPGAAADKSPFLPPPPPLADSPEGPPLPRSPLFPPPPPEVLSPFGSPPDPCFPPPPTARSPLLDAPAPVLPPPPSLPSCVPPPPAPPLDPKLMKEARPLSSFKKSSQPVSPQEASRPPGSKEEGGRPPLPLITTEALQTVQLRPVRKGPGGAPGAPPSEQASQERRTPPVPQYPLKPSAFLKSRNSINEMESESQPASVTSSLPTPAKSVSQGHQDGAAERGRPSRSPGSAGEVEARPDPLQRAPGPSPGKKPPPPISKKPKLFLVVPPPQRDLTVEPAESVRGAAPSPTRGEASGSAADPAGADETDASGSSPVPVGGGAAGPTSPGRREADVLMVQPSASPAPEQEEPGAEDSADRGGHAEEGCPALQDPAPRVPEAEAAGSSPEVFDFLKEEGGDEVMTPSRPRTTEDLFAAIHRSKRKVLGRKDSEDDHARNHSPSPPVTPTGAAPSLASPKQVGSIQRSVRKSSTSSDNFKALLLKKGSRSDTSARMSAAEMLKNTDPRFQRSRSEPAPDAPDSPSSCSPSKSRRAQEEWARNEGLMPRSLSFSGPRYGRSRTPPSAASSRYSLRNRIQSSPMTVISEGEGEAPEPADTRARRVLGAARGCSLDGLVGDDMVGGSLQCGPADGTASAQGRGPLEQCGGPLREAS